MVEIADAPTIGEASDLPSWSRLLLGRRPHLTSIRLDRAGSFHGRLRRSHLDGISVDLLDVAAGRHIVDRTRRHILHMPLQEHLLVFQLAGRSTFLQNGARAVLDPGDLTVGTATLPYRWEFAGDTALLTLRVAAEVLRLPDSRLRACIAGRLSRQGLGRRIGELVGDLAGTPHAFDGAAGQRIVDGLVLLCEAHLLAIGGGTGSVRRSRESAARADLDRVAAAIARRLGDSDLDLRRAADECGLSPRQLQRIMQEQGTTFTEWVRHRRLAALRRDLADPALAGWTIRRIAARSGLADTAHLARAFRTVFGQTPGEFRAWAAAEAQASSTIPDIPSPTYSRPPTTQK